MPRFAAFDVGTNTVLMAVAERTQPGVLVPVLERSEITRLGEAVQRSARLSPEALERTVAAMATFAEDARRAGADELVGVATSAARDADNGEELIRLARERAGVTIEIASGEDEARLTFRAVQEDFGAGARGLVAIDIGGGSTEIVFGPASGPPSFRRSLDLGSVRLTERFVSGHPISPAEEDAIRSEVRNALSALPRAPEGSRAVAVAATATSLAAIVAQENSEAIRRLALSEVERLVTRLAAMSLEERQRVRGLDPRRADVICAGGWNLVEVLRHLGCDDFDTSDRGVRWGLLYERFSR